MASISKPMQHGRRLFELLEEQQEPFLLDVYLLEHGHSDRGMETPATFMCWPASVCRKLRCLNCYGFKRRRGRIFKCALNKVVYNKVIRKALNWENNTLQSGRWFSSFFEIGSKSNVAEFHRLSNAGAISDHELDEELQWKAMEDSEQLSPVSVLELNSDDGSPSDNKIEVETTSTSGLGSPKEKKEGSWVGCEDILRSCPSTPHQSNRKWQYIEPEQLLLDCIRELEGNLWSSHAHSSPQKIQKIIEEEVFSWEKQRGSLANISQLIDYDLSKSRKQWSYFLNDTREIGVEIETKIFEEIREETVLHLLEFYCTLQR